MDTAVAEVAGDRTQAAAGRLIVDDPSLYTSDAAAQACAPGAHDAVWSANLTVAFGRGLPFRIFVDRVRPDGSPGAVLRFCPVWPTAGRGGATIDGLILTVADVFGTLTTSGRNTWSALVSPPLPTLEPDESRTFEVRALEPVPHTVTLRARHLPAKEMVLLSGEVTAAGDPQPEAEVSFFVARRSWTQYRTVGPVRTSASGQFSFRHRMRASTAYGASVDTQLRSCSEPSTAPAGCASETVSGLLFGSGVLVRVQQPATARFAPRARDQALARRVSLKLRDVPSGWKEFDRFSLLSCGFFKPDLSRLTATGYFETQVFVRRYANASSRATVYASEGQARRAFESEAQPALARCVAGQFALAREIPVDRLADQTRAFQGLVVGKWGVHVFSFRQGRAVVHVAFESVGPKLVREIAAKVAARGRRG